MNHGKESKEYGTFCDAEGPKTGFGMKFAFVALFGGGLGEMESFPEKKAWRKEKKWTDLLLLYQAN